MVNVGISTGILSAWHAPIMLAQVNYGGGPAGLLGIIIAVSGAALYFLRSVRPELARDHDIFFAATALLCGGILIFQGWRLDPILLFGEFLLAASSAFFAVESIRLRQVATVQAKRDGGTPIFEEDPPYQRDAYAELDEFGPDYDEPRRRRIGGTRDSTSPRRAYVDELAEETRPPRRSSKRPAQRTGNKSRKQAPPNRPDSQPPRSRGSTEYPDPFDSDLPDRTGEQRPAPSGDGERRSNPRSGRKGSDTPPKSRRPPAPTDRTVPADYVDYQPIDKNDYTDFKKSERDNSGNFDDFDDEQV